MSVRQQDSNQTTRRLQTCDPAIWESFLSHRLGASDLVVEHVEAQQIEVKRTRFVITLAGHSDPITLLGKRTTPLEARFYRHLSGLIPEIAPRCWFDSADADTGYIVIDDVPHDSPPDRWRGGDAEDAVLQLARLHTLFWDQTELLGQHEWLPRIVGSEETWMQSRRRRWLQQEAHYADRAGAASEHAVETAGSLAPVLVDALAGLHTVEAMGGWPDVLDGRHLRAAADLLDDPVPMFQPLRRLPVTLLHGYPGIYNWRVNLFGESRLVDWQQVTVGPASLDLIAFLETFAALDYVATGGAATDITEETLIDSYILQLSAELSSRDDTPFDARALRRAIPAARCMYILFHWFPRFDKWFHWSPERVFSGRTLDPFDQDDILHSASDPISQLQPLLADTFRRFLLAYHRL